MSEAKILIAAKWHRCTVERIDDIPHFSGSSIRRYTCRMKNGDLILCGRNSIKLQDQPLRRTPAANERGMK